MRRLILVLCAVLLAALAGYATGGSLQLCAGAAGGASLLLAAV